MTENPYAIPKVDPFGEANATSSEITPQTFGSIAKSTFLAWERLRIAFLAVMGPLTLLLAGLACSLALNQNGRVLIVGSPGWSYQHWREKRRMMNPGISVLMHECGYLYTDRISQ